MHALVMAEKSRCGAAIPRLAHAQFPADVERVAAGAAAAGPRPLPSGRAQLSSERVTAGHSSCRQEPSAARLGSGVDHYENPPPNKVAEVVQPSDAHDYRGWAK